MVYFTQVATAHTQEILLVRLVTLNWMDCTFLRFVLPSLPVRGKKQCPLMDILTLQLASQ